MTNPMLAELDEVVRLMEVAHLPELESFKDHVCALDGDTVATCYNNVDHNTEAGDAADAFAAAVNFLRTRHATLADMAKRLEAAEEAYRKMLAGIDAEQLVAASKKHGDALSVLKDAGRYRHFRRQIATGRCEILHDLDVGYPFHADDPVGTLERFIDSKLDDAIDAAQEGEG